MQILAVFLGSLFGVVLAIAFPLVLGSLYLAIGGDRSVVGIFSIMPLPLSLIFGLFFAWVGSRLTNPSSRKPVRTFNFKK